MVARENDGKPEKTKRIITPKDSAHASQNNDSDINYDTLRQTLYNSTENTLNRLDELIKASSKKSNKKMYLELFRTLIIDTAQASESLFFLFEYVIDLRASLLLISMQMEKMTGKTTRDVKRLKAKINNLINSPAVVEIGKILQNMQRISKERKSEANGKSAIEYLR